jgi:hypothetical protein
MIYGRKRLVGAVRRRAHLVSFAAAAMALSGCVKTEGTSASNKSAAGGAESGTCRLHG